MTKALTYFAVIAFSSTFAAAIGAEEIKPAEASGPAAAKGKVVGLSNEPQAGVPVQIKGPLGQTVAITDKNGTWSLYNLPAGDYKAQMIGGRLGVVCGAVAHELCVLQRRNCSDQVVDFLALDRC